MTLILPLGLLLLLPFAFYLGWEFYWYARVGLRVVKWHTHVFEYFYVWLLGFFVFALFRKNENNNKENFFLAFTSITLILGITETILQFTGTTKTYLEKVSGFYDSPYTPPERTYYHSWPPNTPHWIAKPEYRYERPTNSLGFGDTEWVKEKKPNEKRILALGDSFTEGDGASYDSSYVELLKSRMLKYPESFSIMNAGVCGSDPFNNFIFLKNKLLEYKPDIILQVLATNDITTDILLRGGMERFQKDGSVKYTSQPWWEPIYAISYISRFFFNAAGYNELLIKGEIKPNEETRINAQVIDLFTKYSILCKKNNIQLIVVLRPDKIEIEKNKYEYDFSKIIDHIKSDTCIKYVDLLPAYRQYISTNKTKTSDYFWKYDGHHNAKGYEMMAQVIAEKINPILK